MFHFPFSGGGYCSAFDHNRVILFNSFKAFYEVICLVSLSTLFYVFSELLYIEQSRLKNFRNSVSILARCLLCVEIRSESSSKRGRCRMQSGGRKFLRRASFPRVFQIFLEWYGHRKFHTDHLIGNVSTRRCQRLYIQCNFGYSYFQARRRYRRFKDEVDEGYIDM